MSHSTMHTSVLAREELRIFEELISRFDSLSEAEMRAVGVTREWSADVCNSTKRSSPATKRE